MAIIKKYVTYTPFVVSTRHMTHPTESVNRLWKDVITFTETNIVGTDEDSRMLGIVEYDDKYQDEFANKFIPNYSYHCMLEITVEKALELANRWYPQFEDEEQVKHDSFELDADGFTLVDKRPELDDEFMI